MTEKELRDMEAAMYYTGDIPEEIRNREIEW